MANQEIFSEPGFSSKNRVKKVELAILEKGNRMINPYQALTSVDVPQAMV
jgi:hypothetical protein